MPSRLYRPGPTEYNQTRFVAGIGEQEKRIMSIRRLGYIAILSSVSALAQTPAAKPDSSEVKALIEKAKKTGGAMWTDEEHFFCEAPRGNSPNDPAIAATKIFDNLYAIGNSGTTVYLIQTSDGLLMIDSLSANQVDSQLLPGFQKLGLDPAKVKIILMRH